MQSDSRNYKQGSSNRGIRKNSDFAQNYMIIED